MFGLLKCKVSTLGLEVLTATLICVEMTKESRSDVNGRSSENRFGEKPSPITVATSSHFATERRKHAAVIREFLAKSLGFSLMRS
jgi:hypothetical protein